MPKHCPRTPMRESTGPDWASRTGPLRGAAGSGHGGSDTRSAPGQGLCEHGPVSESTTHRVRPLADLSPEELASFLDEQQAAYAELRARGLTLDLTRGKPAPAQLDL